MVLLEEIYLNIKKLNNYKIIFKLIKIYHFMKYLQEILKRFILILNYIKNNLLTI